MPESWDLEISLWYPMFLRDIANLYYPPMSRSPCDTACISLKSHLQFDHEHTGFHCYNVGLISQFAFLLASVCIGITQHAVANHFFVFASYPI